MKNLTKELKEQINKLHIQWQDKHCMKNRSIWDLSFEEYIEQLPTEEDEPKEELECAGCEYIHKWADRKYEKIEGITSSRCPNCDEESYIKLPPLNQSNSKPEVFSKDKMLKYASLNQSNPLSKEEIKDVLKKSAFYVEPKDTDIVYINIERTAEQICNLSPASISKEKLHEMDKRTLQFIFDRLINKYSENENADYTITFNRIIKQ